MNRIRTCSKPILFILCILVQILLLELPENNLARKTRNCGISIKTLSAAFGRYQTKTNSDTEYRGNSDLSFSR
jgi:hypothetical protein